MSGESFIEPNAVYGSDDEPDSGFNILKKLFSRKDVQPEPDAAAPTRLQHNYDLDRYPMNYKRLGKFIIINNVNFTKEGLTKREGSDIDAYRLYRLFTKIGFDVTIHHDQTISEMHNLMVKVGHRDCPAECVDCPRDWSCFGVAILSHGSPDKVYGTDNWIKIQNLIDPIKSCQGLVGKPKLFFFQACRGEMSDKGINAFQPPKPSADGGGESQLEHIHIPVEADFLYAYSTAPGYCSWRNDKHGSWFVQSISYIFSEYAKELELCQLLNRVNRGVAFWFESNCPKDRRWDKMKQMPSFVSMLTKDLYFFKDRPIQ